MAKNIKQMRTHLKITERDKGLNFRPLVEGKGFQGLPLRANTEVHGPHLTNFVQRKGQQLQGGEIQCVRNAHKQPRRSRKVRMRERQPHLSAWLD